MPGFTKNALRTPFGGNVFLRSTRLLLTESATCADGAVPSQTIDGVATKILPKGVAMCRITSGGDVDKVGPYQPGTTVASVDEVQLLTVNATSGTFTLAAGGETTAAIAFNATAAAVRAAIELLYGFEPGDVVVTGGPGDSGGTTPYSITFGGQYADMDVPLMVGADVSLLGGGDTVAVTLTTAGVGLAFSGTPAADGRESIANFVGFNNTELDWQLNVRDVEIAVVYGAAVVQANCLQVNGAGAYVALTDETAAEIEQLSGSSITFK